MAAISINKAFPLFRKGFVKGILFVSLGGFLLSACQAAARSILESRPVILTAPAFITAIVTVVADPPGTAPTATLPGESNPEIANLMALPAREVLVVSDRSDGFVNMRSGPGSLYEIVGQVRNGTKIAAIAVSKHGDWLLLHDPADPQRLAWIFHGYTNFDPALQELPIIDGSPPAGTASP